MKNNILFGMTAGLYLFSTVVQAQNYNEREMALAYHSNHKKAPVIIYKTTITAPETTEVVDYPTVSYPETSGFTVEKEKAFYHLSWQVAMRENLSYTEVQSSSDGVNFTTVGFVMNDGSQKNGTFDYFVPSDKNNTSTFRLVQCGLNAQKHTSEALRVK